MALSTAPTDPPGATAPVAPVAPSIPAVPVAPVAPVVPIPVAPVAPPPPEPNVPASLARIHQKLNNETELYKLHLKHYHMSVKMFKHRTSALKLPKDIMEK